MEQVLLKEDVDNVLKIVWNAVENNVMCVRKDISLKMTKNVKNAVLDALNAKIKTNALFA